MIDKHRLYTLWAICSTNLDSCVGLAERDISIETPPNIETWEKIAFEMRKRLESENRGAMTLAESNFCGDLCDDQVMHLFDEVVSLRQKVLQLESYLRARG